MTGFHELSLIPSLLEATAALGFDQPTPIQAAALPPLLAGRDLIAQAQTGSGKTAAFGLALLQRLQPARSEVQALVLCPTRELADQVCSDLRALARFMPNIKVLGLCGGISIRPQLASLEHPPQIAVGTPGRLQDLLRRGALDLSAVQMVVLDEADRMLDMGFVEDVRTILRQTPRERQTALFSATYPEDVRALSQAFQRDPQTVTVQAQQSEPDISQCLHPVNLADKPAALCRLLHHHAAERALIFCNTRQDVRDVTAHLNHEHLLALSLHGEMDQRERDETLVQFANGSCRLLVATDVAARGLDIEALPLVIAYELPAEPEVHVHRIGRTGRAGAAGKALALFTEREAGRIGKIEALTGQALPQQPLPGSGQGSGMQAPRWQTLVIDGGRKDKLRPGDLLGALTGVGELNAQQVGQIDIFPTRSYVALDRAVIRDAQKRLAGGRIKARRFRIRRL